MPKATPESTKCVLLLLHCLPSWKSTSKEFIVIVIPFLWKTFAMNCQLYANNDIVLTEKLFQNDFIKKQIKEKMQVWKF